MLIDPRCAGLVFSRAKAEHFDEYNCRTMFLAARGLWFAGKPIDPVTVLDACGGSKTLAEYIAELMRVTPTAANVECYLDIIEEKARFYEIQKAAHAIIFDCQTADEAQAAFEAIGKKLSRRGRIESVSWSDCVSEYIDRMNDPTPPDYLTWGLPKLDERLHVSLGDYVVIGAESSAGKTALSLQFAYAQAASGKRVGFFSLETPRNRLTDRLMAETQVAGIDLNRSREKKLSPKDFERAGDAGVRSDRVPLRIIRNAFRIEDIRSEIMLSGLQVVYIDYLQLIRWQSTSRFDAVTNISMELHRMAGELGVTVVALSQVTTRTQDGKRRKATKNDLRESDQLVNDPEIIMILNVSSPNTRTLKIDKNKDEGKVELELKFDPLHMTFGYLPPPKNNRDAPHPDNVTFEDLDDEEGGDLPF